MKSEQTNPRVAVYLRTSTDWQRNGIDVQKATVLEFCEEQTLQINEENIYVDEAYSGSLPAVNRPALNRLLNDIKKNKFDILVVYRMDRIYRDMKQICQLIEILQNHNVVLMSAVEALNIVNKFGDVAKKLLKEFERGDNELSNSSYAK